MSSKADAVERLLQVLAVLRAAEAKPVPRKVLVKRVTAYAASSAKALSLKKMMQLDLKALLDLGFDIQMVSADGEEGAWVLHSGDWRLPIELDADEQALLVWVMAAAGAKTGEQAQDVDVSGLIGAVPRTLDLVQTALSGRRRLRLVRHGNVTEFEPATLVVRGGRWFVVGRYTGSPKLYGHRVDRLEVDGLGDPMPEPVHVEDPELVLDQTAWTTHEPRDAELRCRLADLGTVQSWFPRAQINTHGDEAVLTFWYRNEEALVSRILGLGWTVRAVAPPELVDRVRRHAADVLELAAR